jgi:hypothetical protein
MRTNTTVSRGKFEDLNQHPIHILSQASKLIEELHEKTVVGFTQDPQQQVQLHSTVCKESESLTNSNISTNDAVKSAKGTGTQQRNLFSNHCNNNINNSGNLNPLDQNIISPCMSKYAPACTFENNGMGYYKAFYHESSASVPMNRLYFNIPMNMVPYSPQPEMIPLALPSVLPPIIMPVSPSYNNRLSMLSNQNDNIKNKNNNNVSSRKRKEHPSSGNQTKKAAIPDSKALLNEKSKQEELKMEDIQMEKKRKRQIRNREAAQASRERKKRYLKELEEKILVLQEKVTALEQENMILKMSVTRNHSLQISPK